MKKLFVLILAFTLFFASFQNKTYGANLNVSCKSSSGCVMTGQNPIFSNVLDGVWYPGRILTKTIKVENIGVKKEALRLKTRETSGNELRNVMTVDLSEASGGILWQGELKDFFGQEIVLGNLNPGENKDYSLKVIMKTSADNLYQNEMLTFDLTLGFWEEDASGANQSSVQGASSEQSAIQNNVSGADSKLLLEDPRTLIRDVLGKINNINKNANQLEQNNIDGKNTKEVLGKKNDSSAYFCIRKSYLSDFIILLLFLLLLCILRNKIRNLAVRLSKKLNK